MIDLQALKLELETDPSAFGYGPFVTAGNHPELARMVNQSRVTITVRRPDVSVSEVLDVLDVGDFVLAPGNAVSLCSQAATTTALFQVTVTWEEIDV